MRINSSGRRHLPGFISDPPFPVRPGCASRCPQPGRQPLHRGIPPGTARSADQARRNRDTRAPPRRFRLPLQEHRRVYPGGTVFPRRPAGRRRVIYRGGPTNWATRNGSWSSDPAAAHSLLPFIATFPNRKYAVATADAETVTIESRIIPDTSGGVAGAPA